MHRTPTIVVAILFVVLASYIAYFKLNTPQSIPTTKSTPTEEPGCIITVSGQRYNVSQFRSQHKGGDIFVCGTDMTEAFNNQHGESFLPRLSKYKI